MPLYDFRCQDCDEVVEVLLSEVRDELYCMSCEGWTMKRLPAAPAVHFSGYGWTPKFSGQGRKDPHDTLEETESGQLRDKTGAGHDAP